jgi:hypothetical protein
MLYFKSNGSFEYRGIAQRACYVRGIRLATNDPQITDPQTLAIFIITVKRSFQLEPSAV